MNLGNPRPYFGQILDLDNIFHTQLSVTKPIITTDQVKVNSAYEPSSPDQVGAYPGFFGMNQPGVLLLPLDGMLVHTAVARLRGTVRVKCLAQEHNIISQPGIIPGLLDLETSALGMSPLCLPLPTM